MIHGTETETAGIHHYIVLLSIHQIWTIFNRRRSARQLPHHHSIQGIDIDGGPYCWQHDYTNVYCVRRTFLQVVSLVNFVNLRPKATV